jgi:hypothetical protein
MFAAISLIRWIVDKRWAFTGLKIRLLYGRMHGVANVSEFVWPKVGNGPTKPRSS